MWTEFPKQRKMCVLSSHKRFMSRPWDYEDDLVKSLSAVRQADEIFRRNSELAKMQEYLSTSSAAAIAETYRIKGGALDFFEATRLRDDFAIGSAAQAWRALTLPSLPLGDALSGITAVSELQSISKLIESQSLGADLRAYTGTLQTMGFASEIAKLAAGISTSTYIANPDIISSYMASTAAVHALESSLASISSASNPASTSSRLLSGISTGTANLLRRDVSDLAGAARFGVLTEWSELGSKLLPPALEIYTAANLARVMVFEDEGAGAGHDEHVEGVIDERVDSFETLLASVDLELLVPYRGALNALNAGGPDWPRHVMTSLRELITHVLHKLAPDDLILLSAKPEDLYNGKPTRRYRISYIYSGVQGASFAEFIDFDIKATIHLFGVLNGETHSIVSAIRVNQARYVTARVVGLLTSMIEAAKKS
jgi:hypothetical protein